ncbi:hypothetical protein MASSI9I_20592 [Massilia sp. 9I]|nr:hypothetical protein MASSI9I_20592 [Massilia sp. 9I]
MSVQRTVSVRPVMATHHGRAPTVRPSRSRTHADEIAANRATAANQPRTDASLLVFTKMDELTFGSFLRCTIAVRHAYALNKCVVFNSIGHLRSIDTFPRHMVLSIHSNNISFNQLLFETARTSSTGTEECRT